MFIKYIKHLGFLFLLLILAHGSQGQSVDPELLDSINTSTRTEFNTLDLADLTNNLPVYDDIFQQLIHKKEISHVELVFLANIANLNHFAGNYIKASEIINEISMSENLPVMDQIFYHHNRSQLNETVGNTDVVIKSLLEVDILKEMHKQTDVPQYLTRINKATLLLLFGYDDLAINEIDQLFLEEENSLPFSNSPHYKVSINRFLIDANAVKGRSLSFDSDVPLYANTLVLQESECAFLQGIEFPLSRLTEIGSTVGIVDQYKRYCIIQQATLQRKDDVISLYKDELLEELIEGSNVSLFLKLVSLLENYFAANAKRHERDELMPYVAKKKELLIQRANTVGRYKHLLGTVQSQESTDELTNSAYNKWLAFIGVFLAILLGWFVYRFRKGKIFIPGLKKSLPKGKEYKLTQKEHAHVEFLLAEESLKEVAAKLNVSVSAVEKARFRLKKKLGLSKKDELATFLLNLRKKGEL